MIEESKILLMQTTNRIIRKLKLYSKVRLIKIAMGHFLIPSEIAHRKKMLKFYSRFIKEGDLCFDVGAYIGKKTEVFLELGARVVAIEPQKECLDILYKRFRNNKKVIIVSKSVGEKEGFAELSICEDAPEISTMSEKWINKSRFSKKHKWSKKQKVSVTTLNRLIAQYGLPVLCKIDVEGFEEKVLKGLTKPISIISFEFSKEFFNEAKKCINHLLSLNKNVKFNCVLGSTMKFLLPNWVTKESLYAKLKSINFNSGYLYAKFI